MTESEAEALCIKRNANKGKALWNKTWVKVPKDDGYGVELRDSQAKKLMDHQRAIDETLDDERQAIRDAQRIFHGGGTTSDFMEAADRALGAKLRRFSLIRNPE